MGNKWLPIMISGSRKLRGPKMPRRRQSPPNRKRFRNRIAEVFQRQVRCIAVARSPASPDRDLDLCRSPHHPVAQSRADRVFAKLAIECAGVYPRKSQLTPLRVAAGAGNGGELKVQERQRCAQLVKVFRGKQRCAVFNVLGD